jgi:hypothetical protein
VTQEVHQVPSVAEAIDAYARYVCDWAVRKGFRVVCDRCNGDGTVPDYDGEGLTVTGTPTCPQCHGRKFEFRNFGEQVALVHTELSELLEKMPGVLMDDNTIHAGLLSMHKKLSRIMENSRGEKPGQPPVPDVHCPNFSNTEVEAADIVIRLMDMSVAYGWRLGAAIEAKMRFNEGREYKHGKTC